MKLIIIILLIIINLKLVYDIFIKKETFSEKNLAISGNIKNNSNSNSIRVSQICSSLDKNKTCINSSVIKIMKDLPALRKNSICIGNTDCFNPYNLKVLKGEKPFIFNSENNEAISKAELYQHFDKDGGLLSFKQNNFYLTLDTNKKDNKYYLSFEPKNSNKIQVFQAIYLGEDGAFLQNESKDIGCYGDFGAKVGENQCCGAPPPPPEKNKILNGTRICPPYKPMCKGYLQNIRYGKCVDEVMGGSSKKIGMSSIRIALKVATDKISGFISIDNSDRFYLKENLEPTNITLLEQFYLLNATSQDPCSPIELLFFKEMCDSEGRNKGKAFGSTALQNLSTGKLLLNKKRIAVCQGIANDSPKISTLPGGSSAYYTYTVNPYSVVEVEPTVGREYIGNIFTNKQVNKNNKNQQFYFKNSKDIPNINTIFKKPDPPKLAYNGQYATIKTQPILFPTDKSSKNNNVEGNIKSFN